MKKLYSAGIILAASIVLSACGAAARTPAQVLQASASKTGAVQTMKIDMDMSMAGSVSPTGFRCTPSNELPPALAATMAAQWAKMTPAEKAQACQQLSASSSQLPTTFSVAMTGSGVFKAPATMQMSMDVSTSGLSIKADMVMIDGKVYVKNPTTGAWTTSALGQLDTSSLGQMNPGSSVAILEAAKSVTDLGDVSIGDVRTHHYRVVLDPAKIQEVASKKSVFKNPDMQKMVQQYAATYGSSTTTVETWIGINDDLVRRMVMDLQPGAGAGDTAGLPISNMKMKITMNMHDYGTKVDIQAPKVSQ
jgi:hypothetical protein